jgi:hypothetical protein
MLREVSPRVGRTGWRSSGSHRVATLTDLRAGSSIPCAELVFCGFLRFLRVRATSPSWRTLRPNSARIAFQGNLQKMGRRYRSHRRVRHAPRRSTSDSLGGCAVLVKLPRPRLLQVLPSPLREILARIKIDPSQSSPRSARWRRLSLTRVGRDAIVRCGELRQHPPI